MIRDLGTVKPGTTLYIPFHTFDSNDPSASVTLTGLATTDIEVYKDGGVTQRASDAGYALLDTDGIDFDGITGIHGISIDLANNTTANFYEAGSQYWVVISSVTVDAATINFVLATFQIGYPDALLNTTMATRASATSFTLEEGPADNDALNGCICLVHDLASSVQIALGVVSDYVGSTRTVTLQADPGVFTSAAGDNVSFFPPALVPATLGRVIEVDANNRVDVGSVAGTAQTANDNGADINAILVDTNELQGDWANGGRLDNILDGRASQTSVNTIDTNVDAILVDTDTTIPGLINTVDTNVDAILVDTGTDIPARFDGIEGATFSSSTDSLEAIRDRGDAAWTTGAGGNPPQLLQSTTIATLASQTSFTLTAGSADDDAYNGAVVIVTDQSTATQKAVGSVSDYVGSTRTVTLSADPGIFTMAVGDTIDILAATGSVTGTVSADVVSISGDAGAADNLESMYDGTGYTDENGPSSRAQVAAIANAGGGSLNFAATTDNTGGAIESVTFVGAQTGTFANTEAEDSSLHVIDDTGDAIDIVYEFDVGGGRTATDVVFKGYLNGNNDQINIQAYDFAGSDWETRRVLTGQTGTTNVVETVALLSKHTGTGADAGRVLVRFQTTGQSNPQLNVDELLVEAVNIGQSVGYSLGAVWLDTNASNTGTESFVDGVADNPVSTIAAALTIAGNVGIRRIRVAAGSSFTMAADFTNYEIMGDNYTIAFGGQTITGAKITGATVSGTYVGTTAILTQCIINAITGPGITMRSCYFNDATMTANAAGDWLLNDCRSRVAGSGSPNFDFGVGVANVNVSLRSYSGGIEIENMGDTGTDRLSMEGDGALTLNANVDGGEIAVRGNIRITNNAGGTPNITITPDVDGYVGGAVWVDETAGTSTGTVVGIDGTFQNQSNDFDNAQAIADSLGSQQITIRPGNSVTLSAALQGYTVNNVQATLNGGSQNIDATRINGGFLTGIFARAGTGVPTFSNCNLNNVTADRVACLNNCGILGTFTLAEAGVYVFNDAQAAGATSIATLDFASLGGATVSMQRWSGDLTVNNMAAGDELRLHCTSGDDIILGGANGTVTISGVVGTVTDNRTGSPTLNNNAISRATINAEVDTAITDAALSSQASVDAVQATADAIETDTQDIQSRIPAALSGGRMASDVEAISGSTTAADNLEASTLGIIPGVAQTGTLSTTACTTDLTGYADDDLINRVIVFTGGDAAGCAGTITDYASASGLVTFSGGIATAPANNDPFVIV